MRQTTKRPELLKLSASLADISFVSTNTNRGFASVFGNARGVTSKALQLQISLAQDETDRNLMLRDRYGVDAELTALMDTLLAQIRAGDYEQSIRLVNGHLNKARDLDHPNVTTITFTIAKSLASQRDLTAFDEVAKEVHDLCYVRPREWDKERIGDIQQALEEKYGWELKTRLLTGTLDDASKLDNLLPSFTMKNLLDDPTLYNSEVDVIVGVLSEKIGMRSRRNPTESPIHGVDPRIRHLRLVRLWNEVVRRKRFGHADMTHSDAATLFRNS